MSEPAHIVDASPENFAELVIGNSIRGPVMVNFWSAKAGPCLKLWPLLEKLVNEYSGKFLLVNFNTDRYLGFARNELAVTSVPTVKMYYQQQVVDVIHGAESEQSFRTMIDKHLPRASDTILVEALRQYKEEDVDTALDRLKKLQQSDYDNPRIPLTIVKLMFREGRFDEMDQYIGSLSSALKSNEEIIGLQTHANFIRAARDSAEAAELEKQLQASPDDLQVRYQLAAIYLVNDRFIPAMDQLLEIMKRDRGFMDDIGVKGIVSILNLIAEDTERVREYRQKMIDVLSS